MAIIDWKGQKKKQISVSVSTFLHGTCEENKGKFLPEYEPGTSEKRDALQLS
jgi:hypothetical protein